ncbi:hypothetical protein [Bacillus bombysepticus]|uniref:hypothetical protein n=1 Tax=Bacillus bombysepticus TaxID=658666 RepID=UPI00301AE4BC
MKSLFKAAVNKLSGITALETFGSKADYFSNIMKYENRKKFDASIVSFVSNFSNEESFIQTIKAFMLDNFIEKEDIEMDETIQLFTKEKQLKEWMKSIRREIEVGNTDKLWSLRSKSVYAHAKFALDNLGSDILQKEIESNEELWEMQAMTILNEMEELMTTEDFYDREAKYQKKKGMKILRKIASEGDFDVFALVFECRELVEKQDVENNIKLLKQRLDSATAARDALLKQLDEETDEAVINELDEQFARQTELIRTIKKEIASGGQNKGFMTLIKQPVQAKPKPKPVPQQEVNDTHNNDANMQSLIQQVKNSEPFAQDLSGDPLYVPAFEGEAQ